MNIAAAVVSVGVCTDDCLMSGKVFLAEFLTKALSQIYSQSMVGNILGVKRNDIVMTFDIFPFLIFAVTKIGTETGNRKIFITTIQSENAVSCLGISLPFSSRVGFMVNSSCSKVR